MSKSLSIIYWWTLEHRLLDRSVTKHSPSYSLLSKTSDPLHAARMMSRTSRRRSLRQRRTDRDKDNRRRRNSKIWIYSVSIWLIRFTDIAMTVTDDKESLYDRPTLSREYTIFLLNKKSKRLSSIFEFRLNRHNIRLISLLIIQICFSFKFSYHNEFQIVEIRLASRINFTSLTENISSEWDKKELSLNTFLYHDDTLDHHFICINFEKKNLKIHDL